MSDAWRVLMDFWQCANEITMFHRSEKKSYGTQWIRMHSVSNNTYVCWWRENFDGEWMYNTMQYNNYNTKTSFVPKSPATRGQRRVKTVWDRYTILTLSTEVCIWLAHLDCPLTLSNPVLTTGCIRRQLLFIVNVHHYFMTHLDKVTRTCQITIVLTMITLVLPISSETKLWGVAKQKG